MVKPKMEIDKRHIVVAYTLIILAFLIIFIFLRINLIEITAKIGEARIKYRVKAVIPPIEKYEIMSTNHTEEKDSNITDLKDNFLDNLSANNLRIFIMVKQRMGIDTIKMNVKLERNKNMGEGEGT